MIRGKYDYRLHRQTLYFDDLPEAFDGFTITPKYPIFIQVVLIIPRQYNVAGSTWLKPKKSDLFVFSGDLVNNAAWEIDPYIDRFNQLRAPYGQFSILGNHDYGDYVEWNSDAEKAANPRTLK